MRRSKKAQALTTNPRYLISDDLTVEFQNEMTLRNHEIWYSNFESENPNWISMKKQNFQKMKLKYCNHSSTWRLSRFKRQPRKRSRLNKSLAICISSTIIMRLVRNSTSKPRKSPTRKWFMFSQKQCQILDFKRFGVLSFRSQCLYWSCAFGYECMCITLANTYG